jgi:hypothetical protein
VGVGEAVKAEAGVDGEVPRAAVILEGAVAGPDRGRSSLPSSRRPARWRWGMEWRQLRGNFTATAKLEDGLEWRLPEAHGVATPAA